MLDSPLLCHCDLRAVRLCESKFHRDSDWRHRRPRSLAQIRPGAARSKGHDRRYAREFHVSLHCRHSAVGVIDCTPVLPATAKKPELNISLESVPANRQVPLCDFEKACRRRPSLFAGLPQYSRQWVSSWEAVLEHSRACSITRYGFHTVIFLVFRCPQPWATRASS